MLERISHILPLSSCRPPTWLGGLQDCCSRKRKRCMQGRDLPFLCSPATDILRRPAVPRRTGSIRSQSHRIKLQQFHRLAAHTRAELGVDWRNC